MASAITFNGLGSNIDFSKLTDAIVSDRTRPVVQLQNKSANLTNRSNALKQLNGLLATMTSASLALTERALGTGRTTSSSDYSVASATATSEATTGKTILDITRLATSLKQASRVFAAKTDPVLPDGVAAATIELRTGGASSVPPVTITIDSTNNTLDGLRQAINAKSAGLTATIVDVSGAGDFQLVLSSDQTGASGRVELVETADPASGTLANLNLARLNTAGDPSDFSNLNAELKVNGLTITRSKNEISDAVAGVTFSLQKTGAASITVAPANEVQTKLQGFVSAYNSVQDFFASQYKKDEKGRPMGVLAGDSTLRAVQQQLRDAVSASADGNGGALRNLADVGVGRGEDGKLTLDATILDDKLKTSFADVKALLSGLTADDRGIAHSIHESYNNLSDGVNGMVQTAINGYAESVKSLGKSIANQLERVNQLRDSLTRQFAIADAAIGLLNGQGTTLTSVLKSLEPRNN